MALSPKHLASPADEGYGLAVSPATPMLPSEPKFESVTGPTDGMPWYQHAFTSLRPGWWGYMKQFVNMQEFSGAFGDIGLFLPLLTALAVGRVGGKPQIEFGPALFFAGVFTSGLSMYFNVPIPVQPMKTIAAVAISEKYSNGEIIAAGLLSGFTLFFLAATNLITFVAKLVPLSIVRGIQLGVGVNMMMTGFKDAYVANLKLTAATAKTSFKAATGTGINWMGIDSVFVSIILGALVITFMGHKKVPIAIVLFVYGMFVSIYKYYDLRDEYNLPALTLGPDFVAPMVPSAQDFKTASWYLFLPQLPLTLLNSVVALEKLAVDLFPKHHEPAGVRRICFSIAGGNLLFGWFGMLPVCHGAGGLAAQHAFGARSSLAMIFLGFFKIFFALLFGSTCVTLLQTGIFPQSVLGVMLIFSGMSLAAVGLKIDVNDSQDALLLLLTAAGCLGLNTGAGFLIGYFTFLVLLALRRYRRE